MEEEGGVKAPLTRLRRRLSVEQSDDVKSPATPSTPTKKRGRLAAKPQLELIDENVIQNSPKRATRRSIARDVVEEEAKPVTPARRSTRVKSNTSIISDTPQSFDSPRAKRAAARRNSQIGSDTESAAVTPGRARRTRKDSTTSIDKIAASETPVTPGRTRRTRKDSASSEKQGEKSPSKPTTLITEAISEEPETSIRKSISISESDNTSPSSLRKSPRLAKKGRNSKSVSESQENEIEASADTEKPSENGEAEEELPKSEKKKKQRLSESSMNLLQQVDADPKKKRSSQINNTISDIGEVSEKPKRNRTKSGGANLSLGANVNEVNFFSDNESTKRKFKKHDTPLKVDGAGSGDNNLNTSVKSLDISKEKNALNKSLNKRKSRNDSKSSEVSFTLNKSVEQDKSISKGKDIESDKENLLTHETSAPSIMLLSPGKGLKTTVFIEDSDSNAEHSTKIEKVLDGGDQCVPVVYQAMISESSKIEQPKVEEFNSSSLFKNKEFNDSCEPMDIDETLPENISKGNITLNDSKIKRSPRKSSLSLPPDSVNVSLNKSKRKSTLSQSICQESEKSGNVSLSSSEIQNKSKRKSTLSQSVCHDLEKSGSDIVNKSKRKSSLSQSNCQDLEKSSNENKSTLVLSQIKDLSTSDNNVTKSPKVSLDVLDGAKITNKKLSDYLTSTPVQQKENKKMAMQLINTSVITPSNESKQNLKENKNKSKNNSVSLRCNDSDSSDDSEEEEGEQSRDKNSFLDNSAEDAEDDYESGDSQDEEEREYEAENEIVEKGETLTSEEEVSTDTDYEKDSFVVSSDEEDNELLSGSGDDLAMSDNELTMSAKSKKKFNERKIKEQKNASKEMFEARHKLDQSDKISKPPKKDRLRLDSTLLDSDDNKVPPKKNKRMRLESTLESSNAKSDAEEDKSKKNISAAASDGEEIGYKKKKSKRLSESIYNESAIMVEKEITISNETINENDPLSASQIKLEPKTPQKEFDISTIKFTDQQEVEEVQVDENMSMLKHNQSKDPLQVTMAQDAEEDSEDDDSESSISENEEIANNYDSVLKELNNSVKNKKIKTQDLSLNLNEKSQKKTKNDDSIVDQLNLTQSKKAKKSMDANSGTPNEKSVQRVMKKFAEANDDSSSDSIDLKLLFSDDSNGTVDGKEPGDKEVFVPLKRTEAKTDIRLSLNANNAVSQLNTSLKKKDKKRKSLQEEEAKESDNEELGFFIDTTGDHVDGTANIKKQKNKNISFNIQDNDTTDDDDDDEAPTEVSFKKDKNSQQTPQKEANVSIIKTPGSAKKNNSAANISVAKTPISEKKKKKMSISDTMDDEPPAEVSFKKSKQTPVKEADISVLKTPGSAKKNKSEANISVSKTPVSEKKKKTGSLHDNADQGPTESNETGNKRKKRKVSGNTEHVPVTEGQQINNKKRKEREEDNITKKSKVLKENSLDKIHVPRLPSNILSQLDEKPQPDMLAKKKANITSTTNFMVEATIKRRNKPSNYLEESVYLNDDDDDVTEKKQKTIKKPKVLPFLPTACTSYSGFTTNFQVTVLPKKIEFVAKSNAVPHFRNDVITDRKVKKMRTYDMYKKHRNIKVSKY